MANIYQPGWLCSMRLFMRPCDNHTYVCDKNNSSAFVNGLRMFAIISNAQTGHHHTTEAFGWQYGQHRSHSVWHALSIYEGHISKAATQQRECAYVCSSRKLSKLATIGTLCSWYPFAAERFFAGTKTLAHIVCVKHIHILYFVDSMMRGHIINPSISSVCRNLDWTNAYASAAYFDRWSCKELAR